MAEEHITDCYLCRDVASYSLTSRRSAVALSDKQGMVNPVFIDVKTA
jgi:hypothetical protein